MSWFRGRLLEINHVMCTHGVCQVESSMARVFERDGINGVRRRRKKMVAVAVCGAVPTRKEMGLQRVALLPWLTACVAERRRSCACVERDWPCVRARTRCMRVSGAEARVCVQPS